MQVDKNDVESCENLLKTILHKSKMKLDGEELVPAAQLIGWLAKLHKRFQAEIEKPAIVPVVEKPKKK